MSVVVDNKDLGHRGGLDWRKLEEAGGDWRKLEEIILLLLLNLPQPLHFP
jgi:hypothetical protein